ncbi:MAG TPA: TolC family protein [Nannocystaceae bacterium]|nr:TolC family protein [Nannocystaceae bacterium]
MLTTLLLAFAPPPPDPRDPVAPADGSTSPGDPAGTSTVGPTDDTVRRSLDTARLPDDYQPPFPSEDMQLSGMLKGALSANVDLASNAIDVQISEANIMAALGAYDVILTAGASALYAETPQRGSAFNFNLGQRQIAGFVGFSRKLEIGGTISLRIDASRTQTLQPRVPGQLNSGATTLSTYRIAPTLTLTQPLLRGAGLKVNRADINKAKLAVSQAEATQLVTAQNLVRDLVSAYWDVLFAHRDLENKRNSVALAKSQLDRTRALVAAGRQSPVEAKAVEQALAARESDVITAENTLLDRSLTLRTLMGQDFADRDVLGVLPATDPEVRPRSVNVRDEVSRALKQNPQIRQLELAIASGRIDELVAANQRLPQLDFTGSFTPQGRSIDQAPQQQTGDPGTEGNWGEAFRNIFSDNPSRDGLLADWTISGGLTLTWDVQNRGAKGRHQVAKLQIKKAEINLQRAKQQVASGVIRAANNLRTAGKVMDVAQISVELARENLAAEQARFEVGRSTNYDVLLRLDELSKAWASALSAQVNYLKALVQLQALNGEILPAYGFDTP